MRQGTPFGGRNWYARRLIGSSLTAIAYTNPQDSLNDETVPSDLTQPDEENGYAPILLDGTWSVENGIATYQHPPGQNTDEQGNPCWFPSGAWSAPVSGVALVDLVTDEVVHYYDYRDGDGNPMQFEAAAGKRLVVDLASVFA